VALLVILSIIYMVLPEWPRIPKLLTDGVKGEENAKRVLVCGRVALFAGLASRDAEDGDHEDHTHHR